MKAYDRCVSRKSANQVDKGYCISENTSPTIVAHEYSYVHTLVAMNTPQFVYPCGHEYFDFLSRFRFA